MKTQIPYNRTKVVATIGPASSNKKMMTKLIMAGVDVFRLNFSHGNHENHGKTIKLIREINDELKTNIAILADLQGPKIRLGKMKGGPVIIEKDETIIFTTKPIEGTRSAIHIVYDNFINDVEPGEVIKIDDGKIELEVVKLLDDHSAELKANFGGALKQRKGVNFPATQLSVPSMTEKDFEDLKYILTQPVNWIALSFVRTAKEINDLKQLISDAKHPARVIAKIEKPEAIDNIDGIIETTHAVMVARGDLGVEIPVEEVPAAQKMIVEKCIAASKPVIIATQMMESMIDNPMPTRAEITDVANAIYDGADAVMLSGETATGKHPDKVVETMQRIISRTEQDHRIYNLPHNLDKEGEKYLSDAMIYNSSLVAREVDAKAILGMTQTGYTGFKLASYRPEAPIFMFTDKVKLLNMFSLLWGVRAFYYNQFESSVDKGILDLQDILKDKGLIKEGDLVINTGSMPVPEKGPTNYVKVSVVK